MIAKNRVALLCLAGLLLFSSPAWAAPFPNKTKEVVQDANNYLKLEKSDREKFAEAVKQFPDQYKVVVVESTQPEAQNPDEYAHLLYDNYNLDENTMMIVLDMNTQQLGVYPGQALQEKGAKMEMLHEKISSYYEPYRNQKEYLQGIQMFITEVNAEFDRIQEKATAQPASAETAGTTDAVKSSESGKSIWFSLPWWLYGIGLIFFALITLFVYSFIRRRQIFKELDDTEDWKDQLVEKIHQIEVDKPLRRASGKMEDWHVELANRKEHLLHVRLIDIEMMIMEAEEACDRFRFAQSRELIAECRQELEAMQQELEELKQDLQRLAPQTRLPSEKKQALTDEMTKAKEPARSKAQTGITNLGKQVESAERKLTNLRLDYGMSFHELKVMLEKVEELLSEAEAQGAVDEEEAALTVSQAQDLLKKVTQSLERIPNLVHLIEKELPEELKQLEEGIIAASSDGYDLGASDLDAALLQVKIVLKDAKNALEEGSIDKAKALGDAFVISMEKTYERIEKALLAQREAAAAAVAASAPSFKTPDAPSDSPVITADAQVIGNIAEHAETLAAAATAAAEPSVPEQIEPEQKQPKPQQPQREQPLPKQAVIPQVRQEEDGVAPVTSAESQVSESDEYDAEEEYELVIPKSPAQAEQEESFVSGSSPVVVESEDDVLDELERMNGALVRIRQQLKRSYLPGIPEQLKYYFEQTIHHLAQIQVTMERYNYSLEEISVLLNEAQEMLDETERLAERTISSCQTAEGAIQYTNRYRRQNRQVNELLTKAEQAFRQLEFKEALRLAEEARLIVEGGDSQAVESRWLLRKKKKGARN